MANLPTPEDTARDILKIFVNHFKCRPGQGLHNNNLESVCEQWGVNVSDLPHGLAYAGNQGWLDISEDARTYTLTEEGFTQA